MNRLGWLRRYWFEVLIGLSIIVFTFVILGFIVGWDCLLYGVGCPPGSNVTGV
jgi:hypothetical protein